MSLHHRTVGSSNPVPPLISEALKRAITAHVFFWVSLLFLCNGQAFAGEEVNGTIVAAGFGFQIGEVSTITVKTYDALTGEVLSDDVFDLSINEGDMHRGVASQGRIVAGGVGLGATDLSRFMVRVYDANTGQFQWEGELNLKPSETVGGHLVSTVTPRRATVAKIHRREAPSREPLFLLRAMDPASGGLLWADAFSAGSSRGPKPEPISDRAGVWGLGSGAHSFEFSIQMMADGAVLWEDRFTEPEAEEEAREAADEQASVLPAWPWEGKPEALFRDL